MPTTIAVSERTAEKIRRLKEAMDMTKMEDVVEMALKEFEARRTKEALSELRLSEEEASKLQAIIEKRREAWWPSTS